MGSMSIWHWLVVALVILLLFGKGRISDMMGDLAKGIKSFKKGLADDDAPAAPRQVAHTSTADTPTVAREEANRP